MPEVINDQVVNLVFARAAALQSGGPPKPLSPKTTALVDNIRKTISMRKPPLSSP
jgi:hypothetical protein